MPSVLPVCRPFNCCLKLQRDQAFSMMWFWIAMPQPLGHALTLHRWQICRSMASAAHPSTCIACMVCPRPWAEADPGWTLCAQEQVRLLQTQLQALSASVVPAPAAPEAPSSPSRCGAHCVSAHVSRRPKSAMQQR